MEIMPNSTIKFLRNIPFDNDYNDTIYFDNPTQQYNYFAGVNGFNTKFVKYTIDKNYYARHSANVIDVELPNPDTGVDPSTGVRYSASTTESLYDCNYMMFCNESFKKVTDEGYALSKWFYAFITDVEYVNNQVARVTFEIDVLQSWMFDYDLEQCFVEREHADVDTVGGNTVEENLSLGETYLTADIVDKVAYGGDEISAYVLYAKNPDGSFPYYSLVNGIPTTLGVRTFKLESQLNDFETFVDNYVTDLNTNVTQDDIVAMYLFPTQERPNYGIYDGDVVSITRPDNFKYISDVKTGYYTPKNRKLYTYPYIGLEVSNHEGTTQMYHYEYFRQVIEQQTPTERYLFRIKLASIPSPAIIMYPVNYLPTQPYNHPTTPPSWTGTDWQAGYDYGIPISDFQQCAWVGDAFKAWWAQNKASFVTSTAAEAAAGVGEIIIGALTENVALAGMGVATVFWGASKAVSKTVDATHKSANVRNLSTTTSLPIAMAYFGYTLRSKTISGECAEIIDEYFTMFGYATHRVKTPNIHVRERCTFTKTIGCTIKGRLPSIYQKKICKIFDNGIRFWDKDVQVGVYRDTNGNLYNNRCLSEIPT